MPDLVVGAPHLLVRVVRPSGKPIVDADVIVEWDAPSADLPLGDGEAPVAPAPVDVFQYRQSTKTNAHGVAVLGVRSTIWAQGVVTVSKKHHGPVVPPGTKFQSGPYRVPVEYGIGLLVVPGQPKREEVRWGAPLT